MQAWALLLVVAGADPQVTQSLAAVATSQGEARALAVQGYVAGCRGKNRFAFRNNTEALETLRPMFRDEDPKVRGAALNLSACYATDTFEQEILGLLDDADTEVRERAFEEAAHAGTPEILLGLATRVETCSSTLVDLSPTDARWCVFSLYALGESGKNEKVLPVKNRVAQLSVPFLRSSHPKLREHGLRNVELCGTAEQVGPLTEMLALPALNESERKKVQAVLGKLKKKK
jgi:hypothetical protein